MATSACIFCGGKPVTNEHLFPKWMTAVIKSHPRAGNAPVNFSHLMGTTTIQGTKTRRWEASGMDTKTRCVCKPCNEGWMGNIEDNARPYLTSMITSGKRVTLTKDIRQKIATWAALKAMIAKTLGHPVSPASKHWRDWMYKEHSAPPEWNVWLASYVGRVSSFYECADVRSPLAPGDNPFAGVVFDMLIGYLQIKVFGADGVPGELRPGLALRIWPKRPTAVVWPPPGGFADDLIGWYWGFWKPDVSGIVTAYPDIVKGPPW
ncbi:MAG TPA: hypothetical protein VI759_00825 [Dehalococcoidia bacterium]|nr:hypothetical protein [Dehalococcoidia bacterium]